MKRAMASLFCAASLFGCGGGGSPRVVSPAPIVSTPPPEVSPISVQSTMSLGDGWGMQVRSGEVAGLEAAWLTDQGLMRTGAQSIVGTNVAEFSLAPGGQILVHFEDDTVEAVEGEGQGFTATVPEHILGAKLDDSGQRVVFGTGGVWETDLVPNVFPYQFSSPRLLYTGAADVPSIQFIGPDVLWVDQNGSQCTVHYNSIPVSQNVGCAAEPAGDSKQLVWLEDRIRVMSATSTDGGQSWSAPSLVATGQSLYVARVAAGLIVWGDQIGNVIHTSDGRNFSGSDPDISTFCHGTIVFNDPSQVDILVAPDQKVGEGLTPRIDSIGRVWSEGRGQMTILQLGCKQ